MKYISTRGGEAGTSFSKAVIKGLASDGGLFVPEEEVIFSEKELKKMIGESYNEIAKTIISRFATDFTEEEISECVDNAYADDRFPGDCPVGMTTINNNLSVLELFHGPTSAFKDMALQLLPRFMVKAAKKIGEEKEIVILTATSGDTGKAALEGFRDVPGIKVMVFYPVSGVSEMQETQMITQDGGNVSVVAINGNFDNAQTGVKKIFSDKAYGEELEKKNVMLSSANSINFGRLLPQVVYYFYAYMSLVANEHITFGDEVNFTVPTGNFGDILACYYAKKAGLPVNKIICASNDNSVVADFLNTGVYDKNRKFLTTTSPAMDILVSSNLERLLFHASDGNCEYVAKLMKELSSEGKYEVTSEVLKNIKKDFLAGSSVESEVAGAITKLYKEENYLMDPHTAVGFSVCEKLDDKKNHNICVSTASPFKFNKAVATSVCGEEAINGMTEFEILDYLSKETGENIPWPLRDLDKRTIRFSEVVNPEDMKDKVNEFVNQDTKPFYVAVMGAGVVGGGVCDILLEQQTKLTNRFGKLVALKKILDVRDFTGTPYEKFAVKDSSDVIDDNDISLVVVTIGGLDFAYKMCKESLLAGKHVVTSNKEVVAAYGQELTKIAFEKKIRFLYEASAGGGIPIIRPLNICLSSNNITAVNGILNGTTNYILTRMKEAGISFAEALKEAQAKGYAEADPTADVDGYDAARKIAILSSISYDRWIDYKDVPCRGIREITTSDINFAENFGFKIKLIAGSKLTANGVKISVEPKFVPKENLLSSVDGVYNSVLTTGSYTDSTLFYGQGAGKYATASAVLGDIIEVLCGSDKEKTLPGFVSQKAVLTDKSEGDKRFYLRYDNVEDGEYNFFDIQMSAEGDKMAFVTNPMPEEQLPEIEKKINEILGSNGPAIVLAVL